MRRKEKWLRVGEIGVDSGHIMVCDPCYLSRWKDNDFNDKLDENELTYNNSCHAVNRDDDSVPAGMLGGFLAATCQSGFGDGMYSVKVLYNEDDQRIRKLMVTFYE